MKTSTITTVVSIALLVAALYTLAACGNREKITDLAQLADQEFAVPTGTVADKLVLSKFPAATFKYFNSVFDAALAVKAGKAAAVAYDEPILKNIAAKNSGLIVLPEMITNDEYGFAVRPDNREVKEAIDQVVADLRKNGAYAAMMERWLPRTGAPAPMPEIKTEGGQGVLRLGTAAVTEPFSFIDGSRNVVGFDIELASRVAQHLDKKLEVVNLDFGALIPALLSGKVDMIAACITITEERAKMVLFSEPYYTGGIAAMVKE